MFFRKRDHYGLKWFFKKRFTKTILGFSILDIYKCPDKCPKSGFAYSENQNLTNKTLRKS